jgi:hypothetical protein
MLYKGDVELMRGGLYVWAHISSDQIKAAVCFCFLSMWAGLNAVQHTQTHKHTNTHTHTHTHTHTRLLLFLCSFMALQILFLFLSERMAEAFSKK